MYVHHHTCIYSTKRGGSKHISKQKGWSTFTIAEKNTCRNTFNIHIPLLLPPMGLHPPPSLTRGGAVCCDNSPQTECL